MLYEAIMAFLGLMLLTWAAAVWATYREAGDTETSSSSEETYHRTAA